MMNKGVLRFHGAPETLIARAQGMVWDWTVSSDDLVKIRNSHHVSTSLRRADGVRVRIIADKAPSSEAEAVMPGLEDAYVCLLKQTAGQ